jgi:hypothetical protein
MKRFSAIVSLFVLALIVGSVLADSASAAGLGRRGRGNCSTCAAEPACGAAEPACCAAEPACGAAEPACCAEPARRGRVRRNRRAGKCCTQQGNGCCSEPGCAAEPCCKAG